MDILDDSTLPSISLEDDPAALYNNSLGYPRSHHSPSPSINSPSPDNLNHINNNPFDEYHPSPAGSYNNLNLPGTPSYQGSYNGSPYGSPHSNWAELGDADASGLHRFEDDYNPSDYDVPGGNAMSPFDIIDENFMSESQNLMQHTESYSGGAGHHGQGEQSMQFDQNSPASSMDDRRSPSPMRSRASSIASSHGSPHNTNPNFTDNSTFEPPWGSMGVNPASPPAAPSPGASRSPPVLLIPDQHGGNAGGLFPPGGHRGGHGVTGTLGLAPDDGPGINLIPATPVTGGGANGITSAPFSHHGEIPQRPSSPQSNHSQTPPSQQQHPTSSVDLHMWGPQTMDTNNVNVRVSTPSQTPGLLPSYRNTDALSNPSTSNPGSPYHRHIPSPSVSPQPSPLHLPLDLAGTPLYTLSGGSASLSVPSNYQKKRSKSETYSPMQRPNWSLPGAPYNSPPAENTAPPTFSLNSTNMQPNYLPQPENLPSSFPVLEAPTILHNNSYPQPSHQFNGYNNQHLSSGYLGSGNLNVNQELRRASSDRGHQRGSKSEDFSRYNLSGGPGLTVSSGMLAPPNHPSLMVPGQPFRGRSEGAGGHHRRGGSDGSRSSVRTSPYPSPSTSPMAGYSNLPPDIGHDMNGLNLNQMQQMQPPHGSPPVKVIRPNVTTTATQQASAVRRTSEAPFACPVPGCGSTFTRHFNLKGHLRSHNDERPFKCKWPGCEKGFARQHDCKRHEQLHLNIRPYTCEGCSRTFARMDALNRHLRSEGGAECAKHQLPLTEDTAAVNQNQSQAQNQPQKQEESNDISDWLSGNTARAGAVVT